MKQTPRMEDYSDYWIHRRNLTSANPQYDSRLPFFESTKPSYDIRSHLIVSFCTLYSPGILVCKKENTNFFRVYSIRNNDGSTIV